jgi:hypothetical protein
VIPRKNQSGNDADIIIDHDRLEVVDFENSKRPERHKQEGIADDSEYQV